MQMACQGENDSIRVVLEIRLPSHALDEDGAKNNIIAIYNPFMKVTRIVLAPVAFYPLTGYLFHAIMK